MPHLEHYIQPTWEAPHFIRAYTSTRLSGFSLGHYAHFNLGKSTGDDLDHVKKNREKLFTDLNLPSKPIWIRQVHGIDAISLDEDHENGVTADAVHTRKLHRICTILTADCLPILLAHRAGKEVAAIHAGWRGLAKGVIDSTIRALESKPENLLAWLGPAIGPQVFEVGPEVREAFLERGLIYEPAFLPHRDRWLANLYHLARINLNQLGVSAVSGGDLCTYRDLRRFYSYRRDGAQTGRMASLIWIDKP